MSILKTPIIFGVGTGQGVMKCGSTGAAFLGNGRPNWGNDADWGKKEKEDTGKERGKRREKGIGERKEKEENKKEKTE